MELKQAVFAELDEATPGHAILASNTSSLSITEMGEATSRPDRVVGFHFFYPASRIRLIEVVEGEDTSAETAQAASNFAQAIRKMPIRCGEAPGFVVNRILNSSLGVGAPGGDGIDSRSTRPCRVKARRWVRSIADLLGLDTVVTSAEHLASPTATLLRPPADAELVEPATSAQDGKGFYEHGADRSPIWIASRSRRWSRAAWCSRRASPR